MSVIETNPAAPVVKPETPAAARKRIAAATKAAKDLCRRTVSLAGQLEAGEKIRFAVARELVAVLVDHFTEDGKHVMKSFYAWALDTKLDPETKEPLGLGIWFASTQAVDAALRVGRVLELYPEAAAKLSTTSAVHVFHNEVKVNNDAGTPAKTKALIRALPNNSGAATVKAQIEKLHGGSTAPADTRDVEKSKVKAIAFKQRDNVATMLLKLGVFIDDEKIAEDMLAEACMIGDPSGLTSKAVRNLGVERRRVAKADAKRAERAAAKA